MLMGFTIHYWVLIVNPMGRILIRWKRFRNNRAKCCATLQGGIESYDALCS